MSKRQFGLEVKIEDDRLVIAIGIDALMTTVRGADFWHDEAFRITDPDLFAAEIVRALEHEEEDGTTRIHLMIDDAAEWAIDQGAESVTSPGEDDWLGDVD